MQLYLFDTKRGDIPVSLPGVLTIGGATAAQNLAAFSNAGFAPLGFATLNATRDPTTTDDTTAGVQPGHLWFNASASFKRAFLCVDATAGAAKWAYLGADYVSGGLAPAYEQAQAGSSTASIAAEGNIFREVLAAAGGGRNPGTTGSGAFWILGVFTIAASAFDGALQPNGTAVGNRGINIQANGSLGANTNTKRIVLVANPTVASLGSLLTGTVGAGGPFGTIIGDSGAITVNGSGWCIAANIFKRGTLGTNTQLALHEQFQAGPSVSPLIAPQDLTLSESGTITIVIAGSCSTAVGDVTYNFMEANFMN